MKSILATLLVAVLTVASTSTAWAHVVVSPKSTDVGARTVFTVSVPNERQVAVSSVKLNMPAGLDSVQPNVMVGWDISTAIDTDGSVSSITWTGKIPVGQRADLVFKAQAPARAGDLQWKAYQTYADGVTVHWDQKPSTDHGDSEDSTAGPYSVTSVVDDINSADTESSDSVKLDLALYASILALIVSFVGIFMRRRPAKR